MNMYTMLRTRTFREAATSYLQRSPSQAKYIEKVLPHIGDTPLSDIVPYDVRELAERLMPTQTNSTRNRCILTPVRAVFYHANDRGWAAAPRIRNFPQRSPKRRHAASQAWIHAFVRQCDKDRLPHIAALIMFMSQTGARVSEALELRWSEVDMIGRTALLLKTKTDANSTRFLTNQMIARLTGLAAGKTPTDRVFKIRNRKSVNERIKAVCTRAGISYKPSHTCGRHAFANNAMTLGMDIKSTMIAGGWRSIAVFLGTYVNPRNAGRAVAERMDLYQYDSDL
jgi:integrase